jgi:hypothetical protein
MLMVNVLESTLEPTEGEVIVNSGIGSYTPCFSLNSASGKGGRGVELTREKVSGAMVHKAGRKYHHD